jgi:cysteinyl-tRNA synthetase
MTLKAFNTMTKRIESLTPQSEGEIGLYVCGPTVYDHSHIGHARTYIAFDVIVRYLRHRGYTVKYIVNITNVEDKIINRAKEVGVDPVALASKFEEAFFEDMKKLNVVKADSYPRVSDHIPEIIKMVQVLVQKGFGYEVEGDVYFEVSKFKDYARLSRQSLDNIKAGARVEIDERKKSPADFALWKTAKEGEIYWESPWGKGRPGWHIECSAMANKHLGSQLDIHGGGQDLIFPHHDNEIAQSEAYSGKSPAVKCWLHSGLLTINSEKMSKSLGNFISIRDLLQRYESDVIRLFITSTHYRKPIDFNEADLQAAKQRLTRLRGTIRNLHERLDTPRSKLEEKGVNDQAFFKQIQMANTKFISAMDYDFNTPRALAAFYKLIQIGNKALTTNASRSVLSQILISLMKMVQIFGISEEKKKELPEDATKLLKERDEARRRKDWKRADELRTMLLNRGILLEDLPEGTRWRYKA